MPRVDYRNWLHRYLIYPAVVVGRGEGHVFRALQEFRRAERLPPELLVRIQFERLRHIITYARERSPYYKDRLPDVTRFTPEELASQLRNLPILTKTDLQTHLSELVARPRPLRVTRKTTGGSTGQAVTVLKNRSAIAREMAASWLAYGWFGIRIGDRAARFWGSPAALKRRLRFAAADFAMHRIRFSAFRFQEEDLERYWRRCLSFRPNYLYGYVSMLVEFANYVEASGLDGKALELKAIITTSEYLSNTQRETLVRVFGAPVQNEYGCGEVGPIAYGCEYGSMHVMSPNLHVEIVNPDGNPVDSGEVGNVIITDLNNRAMPLIRYQIEDRAIQGGTCKCGRGFPVLHEVVGRSYDFICTPDGRRHHGELLMYYFEGLRDRGINVRQFQAIQKAMNHVEIRVVSSAGQAIEDRIRSELEAQLPGMTITVLPVSEIERARSGKIRVIINDVQDKASASALGHD